MTTQEAYETMRAYFSRPGATYAYDDGAAMCQYRTRSGDKCAVGCLIPDELYERRFEDYVAAVGLMSLIEAEENHALFAIFADIDLDFLVAAQDAHDKNATRDNANISLFLAELDLVAEYHKLKVPA